MTPLAKRSTPPWQTAVVRSVAVIAGAATLGAASVLPYQLTLIGDRLPETPWPLPVLLGLQLGQAGILCTAATALGLRLGRNLDLGAPLVAALTRPREADEPSRRSEVGRRLRRLVAPSVAWGVAAALTVLALETTVFRGVAATAGLGGSAPLWQRLLACLYGGVTEEVLMRLGLLTTLTWLICRLAPGSRLVAFWVANGIVALLFGLGHLPAVSAMGGVLTEALVVRTVALNALPSLLFGELYRRGGLEAAVLAHFSTDLILQLLLTRS